MRVVYGFTSAGTGYQVFKPTSSFNPFTQLVPNEAYSPDARQPGIELPGTAGEHGRAGPCSPAGANAGQL